MSGTELRAMETFPASPSDVFSQKKLIIIRRRRRIAKILNFSFHVFMYYEKYQKFGDG